MSLFLTERCKEKRGEEKEIFGWRDDLNVLTFFNLTYYRVAFPINFMCFFFLLNSSLSLMIVD